MAKKTQSKKGSKQAETTKRSSSAKEGQLVQTPPVETLKKTIAYYFLLSYCPPGQVHSFTQSTVSLRKALAESTGKSEAAYFKAVLPEICSRIVAFSQATREPAQVLVQALVKAANEADQSLEQARTFQVLMAFIARQPGRAKAENRLHRKKGCQFCCLPCQYGYFTLVSEPHFDELQNFLEAEASRPAREQITTRPVWSFTLEHLAHVMGSKVEYIHLVHLGNLAYCLMMLAIAKSRLAFPEEQIQKFQTINQEAIRSSLVKKRGFQ